MLICDIKTHRYGYSNYVDNYGCSCTRSSKFKFVFLLFLAYDTSLYLLTIILLTFYSSMVATLPMERNEIYANHNTEQRESSSSAVKEVEAGTLSRPPASFRNQVIFWRAIPPRHFKSLAVIVICNFWQTLAHFLMQNFNRYISTALCIL